MRYIPHDYQRRAQAFAFDKKKVLLNMGLGTGKTVVSGTVASLCLKNHGIQKVLIIATKRLITTTWPDEFAKWDHLDDLDYRIIQGSPAQRAKKLKGGDIHLINYENLVWLTTHLGRNWDYDMVIFDESSKMKAARTKRFRAMRKVIGTADRVLCLTGTPVSNGILDLWTQIFLLDGGIRLERTFTKYKSKYFDTDYFGFKWTPKPGAEDVITESVKDIALSMTSEEYLQLPPRTDISDRVYLPPGHMAAYAELKKEMLTKLESGRSVEAVNAAVLVGKCLQYTSGAAYVEDGWEWIHDEKLNALSD
jgi:SNF2 family DNA or RNA helicase